MRDVNLGSFLPLTLIGDSLYSMVEKYVLNKNYNESKCDSKFQLFEKSSQEK
jgi:hypothetical protein